MKKKKLMSTVLTIIPLCMVSSLAFADIWYNRVSLVIHNETPYHIELKASDRCAGGSADDFKGTAFGKNVRAGSINWDDNTGHGLKQCGGYFATVDIRFYYEGQQILYYQYRGPDRSLSTSWANNENIFNWWEVSPSNLFTITHNHPANNQQNRPVTVNIYIKKK